MCPVRSVTHVSGPDPSSTGGGGGIRTPETLSSLTVFKTAGFNRSPTPPLLILAYSARKQQSCDNQKTLVSAQATATLSPKCPTLIICQETYKRGERI